MYFLTCHDEFKFAQQALRLQGMDYLLKPVPYDRLQKILSDGAVKIQEKKLDSTWKRYARDCVLKIKVIIRMIRIVLKMGHKL